MISSYEDPLDTYIVYAVSDEQLDVSGTLNIEFVAWTDGSVLATFSTDFTVEALSSSKVFSDYISDMIGKNLIINLAKTLRC